MKYRIKIRIVILFVFCYCMLFNATGQNFVEVTGNGWGPGISSGSPEITDLENNGLLDLLIGVSLGYIFHYEQANPASDTFNFRSRDFLGMDIGIGAKPETTDLDGDGLIDLLVGEYFGNIYHFEQQSIYSMTFSMVNDTFSDILVNYQAAPLCCDPDNDNLLDLLVGDYDGNLHHYEQNSINSLSFIFITDKFNNIDVGQSAEPEMTDLDNDGLFDLIVGSSSGRFYHYEQDLQHSLVFNLISNNFNGFDVGSDAMPVMEDIDGDGLLDLISGESNVGMNRFEQSEINSLTFTFSTDNFLNVDPGNSSVPVITDINGDGLMDMIVGRGDGKLNHYTENTKGCKEFTLVTENFAGIDVSNAAAPAFTDIDDDGLLDLIVAGSFQYFKHYEQSSPGSFDFTLITNNFSGITGLFYGKPLFTQIDNDGLLDLLIGVNTGNIYYYEQSGPWF